MKAEIKQVRRLLERYYAATATPEEMDALRDYFVSAMDIPDELQAEALIFTSEFPAPHPERFFDPAFLADIDAAQELEEGAQDEAGKDGRGRKSYIIWLTSVAAAAVLALVLLFRHGPVITPVPAQEQGVAEGVLARVSEMSAPADSVAVHAAAAEAVTAPGQLPKRVSVSKGYEQPYQEMLPGREDSLAMEVLEMTFRKLDSNIDRLQATLDENADKVSKYINTFDEALDGSCDINSIML